MGTHLGERFASELKDRVKAFFGSQRRFSTILSRSIKWSLIDFPMMFCNYPFLVASSIAHFLAALAPSMSRLERYAEWFRNRKSRSGWIYRGLPPYRTMSAQSKLRAFRSTVTEPLSEEYSGHFKRLRNHRTESSLIEVFTKWERVPNLLENILTPIFWLMGVTFIGLDPKTVMILSRDRELYHTYQELGKSWLGKMYLRVEWLFNDAIPWTYSVKFIAVGLIAYVVLMVLIEFFSVRILYRKGVEDRFIGSVLSAYRNL